MKQNIFIFINCLILFILNIKIIKSNNTTSLNDTKEKKKYISYFLNSTIKTLDDENFDKEVLKGILHNYIILFTIKKCEICNDIITKLENVQKKYINDTNADLKFAKVDILISGWTSMRFELNRLPNIIYVSNRSYAIYPNISWTEENIISFIEDKNKNFLKFPKKVGYFDVFLKIFQVISVLLHEKFPFWNENYSWILVVIFILFFCFVEYLIIKYCCRRTKKENNYQNKHQHQHQHMHPNKKDKKMNKNSENNNKYYKSKID